MGGWFGVGVCLIWEVREFRLHEVGEDESWLFLKYIKLERVF
jgi:hypothetical protein